MSHCGARWRRACRHIALSSLAAALSASPLRAQSTTEGVVGGVIVNPRGAAVADAEIDLTSADTAHVYQARTDAHGSFRFLGLPPGVYDAWITQTGVVRVHVTQVMVQLGRFTPLSASLTIAKAEETVEVREPGVVLDLSSPALSTNIDQAAIDDLPSNSRRWSYFALLTPAVTPDQEGY